MCSSHNFALAQVARARYSEMNTVADIEQSEDEVLMTTIRLLSRLESEEEEAGGPYAFTWRGHHRIRRTIRKLVTKYSKVPSENGKPQRTP